MARRVLLLPPGDPDAAVTTQRDVELVDRWEPGVLAVAGWSDDGWEAVRLAAAHPEIERLVLLATPIRDEADVPEIRARTLLLFGSDDERTGARAARWWRDRIPQARVEMSPHRGHDLLVPLWPRVLSHLAPGTLR